MTGLSPDLDEDLLEMYFDNKKCSGGGGVERVVVNNHLSEAFVTFAESAGKK